MLPGLSNNERKFFLGISNGKITYKPVNGETEYYDSFQGTLKSIIKREATINGKPAIFYDFIMENSGHVYNLSVPFASGVARNIVLSVASVEDIKDKMVKIAPYTKGDYTNIVVYVNGEKTSWIIGPDQIPPVKKVVIGTKEIDDDSERIAMVESYVNLINQRLQRVADVETGEFLDPQVESEDLPDALG